MLIRIRRNCRWYVLIFLVIKQKTTVTVCILYCMGFFYGRFNLELPASLWRNCLAFRKTTNILGKKSTVIWLHTEEKFSVYTNAFSSAIVLFSWSLWPIFRRVGIARSVLLKEMKDHIILTFIWNFHWQSRSTERLFY